MPSATSRSGSRRTSNGSAGPTFESLLGFPAVWVFDRSMPVPEGVGHLRTMFDAAVDIHLWVERLLKFESSDGAGHLSLNCCLMWGEQGNFKDHEVELDLHFGFHRADGSLVHLLLRRDFRHPRDRAVSQGAWPGMSKPGSSSSPTTGWSPPARSASSNAACG